MTISLRMCFSRFHFLLLFFFSCIVLRAADPPPPPSMFERIQRFYSWNDPKAPQLYKGKAFNPGGASFDKTFKTGDYAGGKEYDSKPFATKSFEGAKKSWIGKLFGEKKLPANLQGTNRDADKQFASKEIPLKVYDDLNKKSGFSSKEDFSTREFLGKGKTQGALDNDPHLQEAVKKGLSIDDVKKLLNKPQ